MAQKQHPEALHHSLGADGNSPQQFPTFRSQLCRPIYCNPSVKPEGTLEWDHFRNVQFSQPEQTLAELISNPWSTGGQQV